VHTVFGQVTDGLDVMLSLEPGDHIKSIRFDG
jgi:cyclophilin family peptidyl-prolyl cis-trans isomerase